MMSGSSQLYATYSIPETSARSRNPMGTEFSQFPRNSLDVWK